MSLSEDLNIRKWVPRFGRTLQTIFKLLLLKLVLTYEFLEGFRIYPIGTLLMDGPAARILYASTANASCTCYDNYII